MAVESRLSVRSLSVRFGTHLALDSLDLDVPAGKIVALLGANGSGKSTAVKALTGINPASSAWQVSVGGIALTSDSLNPITTRKRGIRVVHQEAPLIADLTVAEAIAVNLGFPTIGGFIRWKELTQTTLRRTRRVRRRYRPVSPVPEPEPERTRARVASHRARRH